MSMPRRTTPHSPSPARARILVAIACGLAAPLPAVAAPTVEDALKIEPRQKNVDCDRPAAAAVKQCTIAQEKVDGVSALVVRGPAGEIIRAFADTNGNRVVDRWSFFKDGMEVYRDIDSDHDTKSDQSRWFNAAGTRWGVDTDANGTIDEWRQISAEEATAEVVAALRDRDAQAFARLLPSQADLEAAGFSGDRLAALVARTARAAQQFPKASAAQTQLGATSRWSSMLAPQAPGVIPAGSAGVTRDVVAYDNVVALVETPAAGKVAESGQVFIGSLVRCGDAWRPIDVPQIVGAGGDIAAAEGFFTPQAAGGAAAAGAVQDEKLKPLVAKLQEIEQAMASTSGAARGELAIRQVALLEQVLATCAETDRPFWINQLVETLAAYVQEGLVPDGVAKLEQLATAAGNDERLAAFVAFRLAQARYSASMQQPGVDGEKLQNQWFDDLKAFVEKYPRAPEAAEALLQLAFRDEFEGREREAVERYGVIAADFPDTPQARKAAGAARRLQSVGRPLGLAGAGLDGRKVDAAAFRGVPVIVHWWSTDCEPCKVDIAQIRELYGRYGAKKLAVVGVALDGDKAKLLKFLEAKPIPWPQVHEPGGLDSRLAEEFGVLALPTMFLVDAEGNVVDRNVSITDLERKLEKLIEAK
jgi:thiol-disulfide isomerase/thioredoxin